MGQTTDQGGLRVPLRPSVSPNLPHPPGVGQAPQSLRTAAKGAPAGVSKAFLDSAGALQNIQTSLDSLNKAVRTPPEAQRVYVTDGQGKVVAAIGDFIFPGTGIRGRNYFSELHAGDPLGTGDPEHALFNANPDGSVVIGENGWISVLDPFGGDAAWLGTQADTLPVTGAANNGSGLIRLEVLNHTLLTGDLTTVYLTPGDVAPIDGGISNATGIWTVTKVDANHLDLQNSVFVGTYSTGGTVNRVLHIEAITNNGLGLIRVKITAHGFESGDQVNIQNCGVGMDGQWVIKVPDLHRLKPDPDHFDLLGSTYAGGYTLGVCLRYFAGGLFQTIATGPSFPGYNLRAFADGELKIKNALIIDISSTGEIIINPVTPEIDIISLDPITGDPTDEVRIVPSEIFIEHLDPVTFDPSFPAVRMSENQIRLFNAGVVTTVNIRDDTGDGVIQIVDSTGGLHDIILFGGDGSVRADGEIDTTNSHFRCRTHNGIDGSFDSVTVNTISVLTGTPGVGQSSTSISAVSALVHHDIYGGIITS